MFRHTYKFSQQSHQCRGYARTYDRIILLNPIIGPRGCSAIQFKKLMSIIASWGGEGMYP